MRLKISASAVPSVLETWSLLQRVACSRCSVTAEETENALQPVIYGNIPLTNMLNVRGVGFQSLYFVTPIFNWWWKWSPEKSGHLLQRIYLISGRTRTRTYLLMCGLLSLILIICPCHPGKLHFILQVIIDRTKKSFRTNILLII